MATLFIRAVPYLVALVLTVGEIPSRLLAFRHRTLVGTTNIDFAVRWNKVAEAVGYPFLVLFYALSEIGELFRNESGVTVSVWLMIGGLVYAGIVLMALWLFGADLQQKQALPALKLKWFTVDFDGLVLITKIVGVLFPAALDLWLTSRALPPVGVP